MKKIVTDLKNKSLKEFIVSKRDYILLTILFLFHSINNYIWLKIDTLPIRSDEAFHYLYSLRCFDILSHPTSHFVLDILILNSKKPPFSHLPSALFYFIFGSQPDTAVLIHNTIPLFILIFSIYGIGRKLYNKNVGLLAALIITFFPIVFGQSRVFMVDLFSTAMVTLSIYLLILTNNFKNIKYSLLFGFVAGLGLLSKSFFIIFVIGPLFYVLFKSISLNFIVNNLTKFFVFLKQNKLILLVMMLSGACPGIFISMVTSIFYKSNSIKILDQYLILSILGSILFCFIMWVLVSVVIHRLTNESMYTILRLDAYSYLSSFLLLIYIPHYFNLVKQPFEINIDNIDLISSEIKILYFISLLLVISFIIIKLYLFRVILFKNLNLKLNRLKEKDNFNISELNFALSAFIALFLFLMWCIPNKFAVISHLFRGSGCIVTNYNFVSYILIHAMSLLLLIVFIISFLHVIVIYWPNIKIDLRKKLTNLKIKNRSGKGEKESERGEKRSIYILLIWMLVPYLIYSSISNNQPRYLMPMLPAMALVISLSISSIKNIHKKFLIIVIIMLYCIIQFYACSYGIESIPEHNVIETPIYPVDLFFQESGWEGVFIHPARAENWKTEEIIEIINKTKTKDNVVIGCIPCNIYITGPLQLYIKLHNLPYTLKHGELENKEILLKCDYILTFDGQKERTRIWGQACGCLGVIEEPGQYHINILEDVYRAQNIFEENINNYTLIEKVQLPDNSELSIYKRKSL